MSGKLEMLLEDVERRCRGEVLDPETIVDEAYFATLDALLRLADLRMGSSVLVNIALAGKTEEPTKRQLWAMRFGIAALPSTGLRRRARPES